MAKKLAPNVERGRKARQAILNFLHKNGPAGAREIAAGVRSTYNKELPRLAQMRLHKEVDAEEEIRNGYPILIFIPLVKKTADTYGGQAVVKTESLRTARRGKGTRPAQEIVGGPGSTVHRCSETKPGYSRQGGQGAVSGPLTGIIGAVMPFGALRLG